MKKGVVLFSILGLLTTSSVGIYFLAKSHVAESLEKEALEHFEKGDYLASVVNFSNLEKKSPNDHEALETKIIESKDFLVAQEVLKKAQKAAGEGEWLKTKVLLEESGAMLDSSFNGYTNATDLYTEAIEKVRTLEKKIEREIAALREEARIEKGERREAEEKTTKTQKELEKTLSLKEKTEESLEAQKQETSKAKEETEKERLKKFVLELKVYADMLVRGSGYLESALGEIENGKDTGALIFLNQGKVLFNEADEKGDDLLKNRTPEARKDSVEKLLQAAAIFVTASRNLGSAVVYIDEKESNEFKKFFENGVIAKNNGRNLLTELAAFVSSLQ